MPWRDLEGDRTFITRSGHDLNYFCPYPIVQNSVTWSQLTAACEVSSSCVQAQAETILQGISIVCASRGHNVQSLIYFLRVKLFLFYEWGTQGWKRSSIFPKVTKFSRGRATTEGHIMSDFKSCFLPLFYGHKRNDCMPGDCWWQTGL